METEMVDRAGRLVWDGSQPTYKEWKLEKMPCCIHPVHMFPAYLQGMETRNTGT